MKKLFSITLIALISAVFVSCEQNSQVETQTTVETIPTITVRQLKGPVTLPITAKLIAAIGDRWGYGSYREGGLFNSPPIRSHGFQSFNLDLKNGEVTFLTKWNDHSFSGNIQDDGTLKGTLDERQYTFTFVVNQYENYRLIGKSGNLRFIMSFSPAVWTQGWEFPEEAAADWILMARDVQRQEQKSVPAHVQID